MYICNECWHAYDSAEEAGECEILDIEANLEEEERIQADIEYVALLTDDEYELWYEEAL